MANVDIVYDWFGGSDNDLLYGIDRDGKGYFHHIGGEWEPCAAISNPAVTPALAALARIAETLGSVTWRADNVIDIDN